MKFSEAASVLPNLQSQVSLDGSPWPGYARRRYRLPYPSLKIRRSNCDSPGADGDLEIVVWYWDAVLDGGPAS